MSSMKICYLATLFAAIQFGPTQAFAAQDHIMVLSAVEDAGGATQSDLDLRMLNAIEQRTVELFSTKVKNALRAQGQPPNLPKLQVNSHYVEAGARKLAVVKIAAPHHINQVFLYGIVGNELRRVACARTSNFDESIPLFYGECGSKVKEVFGVDIDPK